MAQQARHNNTALHHNNIHNTHWATHRSSQPCHCALIEILIPAIELCLRFQRLNVTIHIISRRQQNKVLYISFNQDLNIKTCHMYEPILYKEIKNIISSPSLHLIPPSVPPSVPPSLPPCSLARLLVWRQSVIRAEWRCCPGIDLSPACPACGRCVARDSQASVLFTRCIKAKRRAVNVQRVNAGQERSTLHWEHRPAAALLSDFYGPRVEGV